MFEDLLKELPFIAEREVESYFTAETDVPFYHGERDFINEHYSNSEDHEVANALGLLKESYSVYGHSTAIDRMIEAYNQGLADIWAESVKIYENMHKTV